MSATTNETLTSRLLLAALAVERGLWVPTEQELSQLDQMLVGVKKGLEMEESNSEPESDPESKSEPEKVLKQPSEEEQILEQLCSEIKSLILNGISVKDKKSREKSAEKVTSALRNLRSLNRDKNAKKVFDVHVRSSISQAIVLMDELLKQLRSGTITYTHGSVNSINTCLRNAAKGIQNGVSR